eukprot:gene20001-23965_t
MTTTNNDELKLKLKDTLNKALTLRNVIKTRTPATPGYSDAVTSLKMLATQASDISTQLSMEHGQALSAEFNAFAVFCEINAKGGAPATNIDTYEPLFASLEKARTSAVALGDKSLDSRIIELLTNIYAITDQFENEIELLERACSVDRSIPKVMALMNAYFKKLAYVYGDRDRIYALQEGDQDAYMKLHINCWEQYLWLKEAGAPFNRDAYIKQHKGQLFKLAIYLGSMANPLISAKDPEVLSIAMEAFDEAFYIADLTNDPEFFCAATAHKSSAVYRTLPADQRESLLASLKKIESEVKPINSELRDLIDSIENKAPSLHPEMKEAEEEAKKQSTTQ